MHCQFVIFIVSLFPSLSECNVLIVLPGLAKPENFDPLNESITTYLLHFSQFTKNIFLFNVRENGCPQAWWIGKNDRSVFLYLISERGWDQMKSDLCYQGELGAVCVLGSHTFPALVPPEGLWHWLLVLPLAQGCPAASLVSPSLSYAMLLDYALFLTKRWGNWEEF